MQTKETSFAILMDYPFICGRHNRCDVQFFQDIDRAVPDASHSNINFNTLRSEYVFFIGCICAQ